MFWQVLRQQQDALTIEDRFVHYLGTNSVKAQDPTPDVPGNTWLALERPLGSFVGSDGKTPLTLNVSSTSSLTPPRPHLF